ncbi:MAG: hypothetical protein IPL61_29225 [Myxococcales bacterium]|nr:hypothetical protein [Myxococcales bacterium]
MADLAFVLLRDPSYPEPDLVIASAGSLGIELSVDAPSGDLQTFTFGDGGVLFVALMPPHPDAPNMASGPTAVPPPEATAARAHLMVTALGLTGAERERDTRMAALTAAVIEHVPAVGAMLGHGVVFHKAALFRDMAKLGVEQGALPSEIAVDITTARESEDRMSFLSHGMARYGREEIYVTCPIQGKGALDFVFGMVH